MQDNDKPQNSPADQDSKFDYPGPPTTGQPVQSAPVTEPVIVPPPVYSETPWADERRYEPVYGDPYFTQPADAGAPQYGTEGDPYFASHAVPPSDELPPRRRKTTMWIALGVIALLLFSSLLALQAAFRSKPAGVVPVLPEAGSVKGVNAPSPSELSGSFREISRQVKPAVVYINITEKLSDDSSGATPFGFPAPGPRSRRAAGSGFIVTNDGYIITNNHVVENASKIEVTLADNRKYKGTVIGTDKDTDLAVIKIEENNLPVAILGNSDDVQQGDWVLALGSPFGLQQTLTAGIVSATGREYQGAQLGRFIQTDASINPGNSGGPLISMNAEVIGINTFIISRQSGLSDEGGNVGIGFAVTSNVARQVFTEIVKKGKVSRGYIGVNVLDVNEARSRAYGIEVNSGAFVSNIPDSSSPAAKAGLRIGDVITAFDGKKVSSPRELTDAVTSTPVGKSCKVDFIRDGQAQSATVELVERPSDTAINRAQPDSQEPEISPASASAPHLGIEGQTITADMASRMRVPSGSGVLVKDVKPGSPASESGLRHGDVIQRIDRFPIRSSDDLLQADKSLKNGDEVSIQVIRGGQTFFLTVTIE